MFCSNCGKQLRDDAKFCDGCGAKIENNATKKEEAIKEVEVHKCPCCGSSLPYDALTCPACGSEIRGQQVSSSVQKFFEKYSTLSDENTKMDLVKTFPVPNSREDIIEFMLLASSNYDAKYYATNSKKDSLASAWLLKVEQCYQKGKIMFTDPKDLQTIEDIYKKVHGETKKIAGLKLGMIIGGIAGIILGVLGVVMFNGVVDALSYVSLAVMAVGIIVLVIGCKRKKTNKEIEEEKQEKLRKEEMNKQTKVVEKRVVVKESSDSEAEAIEEEIEEFVEDVEDEARKSRKRRKVARAVVGTARAIGFLARIGRGGRR